MAQERGGGAARSAAAGGPRPNPAAGWNRMMIDDVHLAFPTPILQHHFENTEGLNTALNRIVQKHEKRKPGKQVSLVDGWHSETDLLAWPEPEIQTLRQMIFEAVQYMSNVVSDTTASPLAFPVAAAEAWANVSRDRAYHKVHNHMGSTWSGVYYVATGTSNRSAPDSGTIEFLDPRPNGESGTLVGAPFTSKLRFQPEPGLMVLFPSWIYHYVNPFRGKGTRISIAFNLNLGAPERQG